MSGERGGEPAARARARGGARGRGPAGDGALGPRQPPLLAPRRAADPGTPDPPQLLLSRENGSCYTQRFGETFLSRLFLKFNILYWTQFFLNPKPPGPGKLDSNQMIVDIITVPN